MELFLSGTGNGANDTKWNGLVWRGNDIADHNNFTFGKLFVVCTAILPAAKPTVPEEVNSSSFFNPKESSISDLRGGLEAEGCH